LSVSVLVDDPSWWSGKLKFSLAPGAPPGATIDARTGVFTWTPPTGQPLGVYNVALSAEGGVHGQTAGETLSIEVTPATARRICAFRVSAQCMAASPDGRRLLGGQMDGSAILWNTASGEQVREFRRLRSPVHGVAFSPDGAQVLTAQPEGSVILWYVASGGCRVFRVHAQSASFASDGQTVLTGSMDGMVVAWDVATGERTGAFQAREGRGERLNAVLFSPDGRRLLTEPSAILWDILSGQQLRRFAERGRRVTSAAFSLDSWNVLVGFENCTAAVSDVVSGKQLASLIGHLGPVTAVAFSSDGRRVLTGSDDHTAILWDAATGRQLVKLTGHRGPVTFVAFPRDGRHAVTSDYAAAILWDISGVPSVPPGAAGN
jgi:WD40 repeat protein